MSWKWRSVLLTAGLFAASSGQLERATQECWKKLNGKAQVEWYGHLRMIDESDRAEAVRTSTARSMAHYVATDRVPRGRTRASGGLLKHSSSSSSASLTPNDTHSPFARAGLRPSSEGYAEVRCFTMSSNPHRGDINLTWGKSRNLSTRMRQWVREFTVASVSRF